MKNSSDSIGNRTRDLRLLAQCLIPPSHRVPPQLVKGRHYEVSFSCHYFLLRRYCFYTKKNNNHIGNNKSLHAFLPVRRVTCNGIV